MSNPVIERLTEMQDKVIDTLDSAQEPVVKVMNRVVELIEERIPELPTDKMSEKLPTLRDLVDNQYDFAGRLLKSGHNLSTAMLDAVEPVTVKVVKPTGAKKAVRKATDKVASVADAA